MAIASVADELADAIRRDVAGGRKPARTAGQLTANNAGTINSGDATTDAVITALRTRLVELELVLSKHGLIDPA